MRSVIHQIYRNNIHIAGVAVFLSIEQCIVAYGNLDIPKIILHGALGTVGYHYLRQRPASSLAFRLVLAALILWLYLFATNAEWLSLAVGAAMVFAYNHPFGKSMKLRSHGLSKTISIGLCWTLLICGIPASSDEQLLYACSVFFLTCAISIQCDVRDIDNDRGRIRTLPILLGIDKTNALVLTLVALSFVCLWPWIETCRSQILIAEYLLMLLTMGIALRSRSVASKTAYEILSDLSIVMKGILALCAFLL